MINFEQVLSNAVNLTKEVPDDLRPIAFKAVLETMLRESDVSTTSVRQEDEPNSLTAVAKKLAAAASIESNKIYEIFDFDVDTKTIRILKQLNGSEAEKQVSATLLFLTAKKYVFGESFSNSKELKPLLQSLGIGSLVNLSTNLKSQKDAFVIDAEQGGTAQVKITVPGLQRGLAFIQQLANS